MYKSKLTRSMIVFSASRGSFRSIGNCTWCCVGSRVRKKSRKAVFSRIERSRYVCGRSTSAHRFLYVSDLFMLLVDNSSVLAAVMKGWSVDRDSKSNVKIWGIWDRGSLSHPSRQTRRGVTWTLIYDQTFVCKLLHATP